MGISGVIEVENPEIFGELEIRFMPLATDIVSGDVLITSGLDGNYPYGVPVGTVSSVVREESFPFASVKIMPIAKVNAFRQVVVLSQLELGTSTKPEQIKKSIEGESIE